MQAYSGYGGDFGSTSPLPPMPPRPPRRRIGLLSFLAVALAAGALGAGTVVALYHPAANSSASAQPSIGAFTPAPLPSTAVPTPSSGSGTSGPAGVGKVEEGVMMRNSTLQYRSERAAGTGMVINAGQGLVLTNNHVIEGATKITATVAATGQKFQAKVLGYDVTGDVALIRLQNPSGLHAGPVTAPGKGRMGASVGPMANAAGQRPRSPPTTPSPGL